MEQTNILEKYETFLQEGKIAIKQMPFYLNRAKGFYSFLLDNKAMTLDKAKLVLEKYKNIYETNWIKHKRYVHYFLFFLNENGFMQNTDETGELDNLYQQFKQHLDNSKSAKGTARCVLLAVRKFLRFLKKKGTGKAAEINRKTVKDFTVYLTLDQSNLSISYVRTLLANLNVFFVYLADKNLIKANYLDTIKRPRKPGKVSTNLMSKKEMSHFIHRNIPETPYEFTMKTLFVLFYSTGLRISEIRLITLKDLSLERQTVRIIDAKDKIERVVPFSEVAGEYLKLYLEKVRPVMNYGKTSQYLFAGNRGNRLSKMAIGDYLQRFIKRAGIDKKLSSHCFRHSYGSHMLESGCDIRYIADLLGHRKLSTTQGYTKVNVSDLKKVIRKTHPREQEKEKHISRAKYRGEL